MLKPDENLELINYYTNLADKAILSDDFVKKMGGLTIYAGIMDFLAIQVARSIEQVILKEASFNNKPNPFEDPTVPHEDRWFYENKVSTRRILKETAKFAKQITSHNEIVKHTMDMCEAGEDFLNHRITAIHFIGNPRITKEKMEEAVKEAINSYYDFKNFLTLFKGKIFPFTFSLEERKKYYGVDEDKGVIVM